MITTEEAKRLNLIQAQLDRMRKPELILAVRELLDLINQKLKDQKPTLVLRNMTPYEAAEQLGELVWRNGDGVSIKLKDMDADYLGATVGCVKKRVDRLAPSVSGSTWVGLTMRQWQKVLFYYQEKDMPITEYGYYNKIQADFLATEEAKYEQGVSRRVYLEDNNNWW